MSDNLKNWGSQHHDLPSIAGVGANFSVEDYLNYDESSCMTDADTDGAYIQTLL